MKRKAISDLLEGLLEIVQKKYRIFSMHYHPNSLNIEESKFQM